MQKELPMLGYDYLPKHTNEKLTHREFNQLLVDYVNFFPSGESVIELTINELIRRNHWKWKIEGFYRSVIAFYKWQILRKLKRC